MTKAICYDSNNSGGYWWLSDDDWRNLEAAGWEVRWAKDDDHPLIAGHGDRWLGALARSAYRYGVPMDEAIAEWERVTGQDADDEGCSCCGQPHNFYEEEREQIIDTTGSVVERFVLTDGSPT